MLRISVEKLQLVNFFPWGNLSSMFILIKYQTMSLKHIPDTVREAR